jgi:hypothetical protein
LRVQVEAGDVFAPLAPDCGFNGVIGEHTVQIYRYRVTLYLIILSLTPSQESEFFHHCLPALPVAPDILILLDVASHVLRLDVHHEEDGTAVEGRVIFVFFHYFDEIAP